MSKKCQQVVVLTVLLLGGTVAHADLVGYWPFNDGAGTIAVDASGYGHDAVVEGGGDSAWVEGQLGGAIEVGNGAWVSVPPEAWVPIDDQFTVAFWSFGYDGLGQNWGFFATAPGSNRMVSNHLPWTDSNVYYDTADSGGAWEAERISKPLEAGLATGVWNHWAFTKNTDTGDKHVYLNGELWHSGANATGPVTEINVFTIGSGPNGMEQYLGVIDDFQLYDVELTQQEIQAAMYGISKAKASGSTPADETTDIPRDVSLAWEAGEYAVTHDVYLGTVFEDVNEASRSDDKGVLISQSQSATTYDIDGVLEYGQTYYWRIDEVNGAPDNTIFKGKTWSFTVEPLAYPIANVTATSNALSNADEGPDNTVNGSGLNENDEHSVVAGDMWLAAPVADEPLTIEFEFDGVYKLHEMLLWNYNVQFELLLGFGIKTVTVEYSEDGETWTVLGDVTLNQATATATYAANTTIDFGGVAARYVRLTVISGYGMMGQFGLSEVRFLSVPVQAREPEPEDGAAGVGATATLSWRAGREAVSHEVYLSTDPEALDLIDTTSAATVDPGALDLAATYYWKVTEVNEAEAISTWEGAIWNFSTEAYLVVEDFEDYDDEDNVIYESWIDGWVNGTGSTVGYLQAPFAEQTNVHGGSQAMPLFYDNAQGVTVSEAERTLEVPMDWTVHGIKTLSVAFAGAAENTPGQLYIKVNGTRVDYRGAAADLQASGWMAWMIDMSALGNVGNVTSVAIGVEGAGAAGVLYVDDIRLYPQEAEMVEPVEPAPAGLVAYYTFDSDFQDSSGNGNHAEAVGGAVIANDPTRGSVARLDGLGDAIMVPAIGGGTASEVTISVWMTTDLAWTGGFLSLFHCDGWTAGDIHMHISDPGHFTAGVSGLMDNVNLQSATLPEVDEWYNVTVTVSAAEGNLYVNGVREDSRVSTTAPESFSLGEGHLGVWLNGTTFERALTGQIDEVRFYDRVLSYGEVMGLAGRTKPLFKPF